MILNVALPHGVRVPGPADTAPAARYCLPPLPLCRQVLLGPFVDAEQPVVAGGMLNVTFQLLFQTQVLDRLEAWQASLPAPCQVVLLPSVRDVFHHPTFPQPPLNLGTHDQVRLAVAVLCVCRARGCAGRGGHLAMRPAGRPPTI
jgi:hypothetical protein